MPSFVIYDAAGNILGAYVIPDNTPVGPFLKANTPAGAQAMPIAAGHDALFHQGKWKIKNGQINKIGS